MAVMCISTYSTSNYITDLRFQSDQNVKNSLINVNNIVAQLFDINKAALHSGVSPVVLDQRDNLLTELSQQFSIKVDFASNGAALVKTLDGSNIVDMNSYSIFEHNGLSSRNAINEKEKIPAVLMKQYDSNRKLLFTRKAVPNSDSKALALISGGKIDGFISLRDDILVQSSKVVRSLSSDC